MSIKLGSAHFLFSLRASIRSVLASFVVNESWDGERESRRVAIPRAQLRPTRTGSLDKRTLKRTFRAVNTISATKARNNLYALIDEANESHDPIQITGKRGNAVLIAEDDWRAIRETLYLHSIPGMVKSIRKARKDGIAKASEKLDW